MTPTPTFHRRPTIDVRVGHLLIGSRHPVRIQSMVTASTLDTEACIEQAVRIIERGGELVRFTTQGTREAENLRNIKAGLLQRGYRTPIVADVHFNAAVADVAALYADKVRINPGNYVDRARKFEKHVYTDEEYADELKKIEHRLVPFLRLCSEHGTAIRVGVNHGSLSDRIMSRYGDTAEGVVESCMEFLRVCQREKFLNVVVSIKASNTLVMVQAVRLLVATMDNEDMHYPLHLGVTEAGEGADGRIRSGVGIGTLLCEGIGDTVRVSLSEPPENEIPVARRLIEQRDECLSMRREIADDTLRLWSEEDDWERFMLLVSMASGQALLDRRAHDVSLHNPCFNSERLKSLQDDLLQAARIRFSKTEYISCPGCGRTLYDLPSTLCRIKQATQGMSNLKIAVMGCIVNGPGEMADADYGYVGAGRGKVSLYRGKQCVLKNIDEADAVEQLLRLIETDKAQHP